MKSLNLNAYGVSEMSTNEMSLVDGGSLGVAVAICFAAGFALGLYLVCSAR